MFRFHHIFVVAAFMAVGASASLAQGVGLGTVVDPIEPERQMGLPEMAPPSGNAPVVNPSNPQVARPPARAAAAPQPTSSDTWSSECREDVQAGPKCQATVRSTSGEQIALVLSVAGASPSTAAMQMALPLGFDVQKGASISIGEFSAVMPVSRCTAQGCIVEQPVSEAMLEALRSGSAGTVTVMTVDDTAISLPLPGAGAHEALAEAMIGAPASLYFLSSSVGHVDESRGDFPPRLFCFA